MADLPVIGPSPVLVVEDEALQRLCIDDYLQEAGFEVIDAASAMAALAVMARRPGAPDGMGLARMIHQHWPHVLLLITSGYKSPPKEQIADHGHFLPSLTVPTK